MQGPSPAALHTGESSPARFVSSFRTASYNKVSKLPSQLAFAHPPRRTKICRHRQEPLLLPLVALQRQSETFVVYKRSLQSRPPTSFKKNYAFTSSPLSRSCGSLLSCKDTSPGIRTLDAGTAGMHWSWPLWPTFANGTNMQLLVCSLQPTSSGPGYRVARSTTCTCPASVPFWRRRLSNTQMVL
jgi:hypothetical protein